MSRLTYGLLLSSLMLAGCASHPNNDTALQSNLERWKAQLQQPVGTPTK